MKLSDQQTMKTREKIIDDFLFYCMKEIETMILDEEFNYNH